MLILQYKLKKFKKIFINYKKGEKMKKIILCIFLIINCISLYSANKKPVKKAKVQKVKIEKKSYKDLGAEKFYKKLDEKELEYNIFQLAMDGYERIDKKNEKEIIIIDFSKDSSKKRFFFIDLENAKIKYKTYVTHGKNSGAEKALSFSNQPNSYKSSIGFFLTRNHYKGSYGYSVRLKGLEEEFNSNAIVRGIVIHGSKEAEEKYIKKYGFLGRTEGCPALPLSISREIMEKISRNTVLFIYGDDEEYSRKSKFFNRLLIK